MESIKVIFKSNVFLGRIILFWCFMLFSQFEVVPNNLKLASIFSDNVVLQRETNVSIWGKDISNSKIVIVTSWNNKMYVTNSNNNGDWKTKIQTPEAGGPYEISVFGSDSVTLKNILIGEVWLASGQSNMSIPVKGYVNQPVAGSTEAILNSGNKRIHFINIPPIAANKPQDSYFDAKWEFANVTNVGNCSAVSWFFGERLNQLLDVPIGIINASFGATTVEAWMPQQSCLEFKDITIPEESNEKTIWISNIPTLQYNGMIHPIKEFDIKGVIWYQGESNVLEFENYPLQFASMVKHWRKIWESNFPFYYTQIAPFNYNKNSEVAAHFRESQLISQNLIPNSSMAVTLDLGEESQIHPSKKMEVGLRLALMALRKTYGLKGFEFESPQYENMTIDGDKIIINFSQLYMGLTSFGKELELFEIAGENKVFHKANAYIDEEKSTVVVYCDQVKEPKAVRYAFRDYVVGELFGTGGLPVSSFRTDNW